MSEEPLKEKKKKRVHRSQKKERAAMTEKKRAILTTEEWARRLGFCIGCGKPKPQGLLVCVECWKYGERPLKDYQGSFEEWLKGGFSDAQH